MSFDKITRTKLANAVGKLRDQLKSDVMDQLRRLGFQEDGTLLDLDRIAGLREDERQAGDDLRALLNHLATSEHARNEQERRRLAYDRMAREIGFTTLNRIVALRMAEERGLIIESTAKGYDSAGFQMYQTVANGALGDRHATYRAFIERTYDELALDLPTLFDRADPSAWVFPTEQCLDGIFAQLNAPDIAPLWKEDEAIGWAYQYFNDPDERKKMREAGAPRNTRELAVRNQFFTPRYVVEFLTDNTLGRIWYEMRRGETRLVDQCDYLIRRKHPVWLAEGETPQQPYELVEGASDPANTDPETIWLRPKLDPGTAVYYAHTIDGYGLATQLFPELVVPGREMAAAAAIHERVFDRYREIGNFSGPLEELRIAQFFAYRADRHGGGTGDDPFFAELHEAICSQWDLEVDVIEYRKKKDPRDLRVLDPACGSGHFLLYAFDLLLTIYDEAWEDADLGPRLQTFYEGDQARFKRDVPRLILEHNLYGVDIDPRAAQIAQLALWLRAQRAWAEASIAAGDRPRVQRVGIVTAEPMPDDPELIAATKAKLDPRLRPLVDVIWDKMKLAGEAGTLLRIEEEIRDSIADAARKSGADLGIHTRRHLPGFGKGPEQASMELLVAKSEASFWSDDAEPQLLRALREVDEESGAAATRRMLFARNASAGFAFIDLSQLTFDAILMNPPFGDGSISCVEYFEEAYPNTKNDLYAAFVERGLAKLAACGRTGAITSRTGFFLGSFQNWRNTVLVDSARLESLVDLGMGVLDAMVETAAYVLQDSNSKKGYEANEAKTAFFRLVDCEPAQKGERLYSSLISLRTGKRIDLVKMRSLSEFKSVPSFSIPYWAPQEFLQMFKTLPRFESKGRKSRAGLQTSDDFRFLRLWWEVAADRIVTGSSTTPPERFREMTFEGSKWIPFAKGGEFAPFFSDLHLLVNWSQAGSEMKAWLSTRGGGQHYSRSIRSEELYFKPGLTYPRRARQLNTAPLPKGSIISVRGSGLYADSDSTTELLAMCGILNSSTFDQLVRFTLGREIDPQYDNGSIGKTPFPCLTNDKESSLAGLTKSLVMAAAAKDCCDERSHLFGTPVHGTDDWQETLERLTSEVLTSFGVTTNLGGTSDLVVGFLSNQIDEADAARATVSVLVGRAFGRWDVRPLDERRQFSTELEFFAPLPSVSPATLLGSNGLPATHETFTEPYPIPVPWDGVLELGGGGEPTNNNLLTQVRRVLEINRGDQSEVVVHSMLRQLSAASLETYLLKPSGFFSDHLRAYSESKRLAPIYWPLQMFNGGDIIWVYYPRISNETMFTINNSILEPKIAEFVEEQQRLERGLTKPGAGSDSSQRDRYGDVIERINQLEGFRSEILRIAALPFHPDLDDGVIINAAPFWRLFRLPKWQKATRETWEKLEKGEYDWSHMAMNIWPERVLEKCKTDKSIAIAHRREDLYVEPSATSRKKKSKNAPVLLLDDEGDDE